MIIKSIQVFFHIIKGILVILFTFKNPLARKEKQITRQWEQDLCKILKVKLEIIGKIYDKPCLFSSNHISWLDIPIFHNQIADFILANTEVKAWPLIGLLTAKTGQVFLHRGKGQHQIAMEKMTEYLQKEQTIIFFPEGTTTDGSAVKRFYRPLFQAAINANVPIQPITIAYPLGNKTNPAIPYIDDMTFMQSLTNILKQKEIKVKIILHPIIEPQNQTTKQLALAAEKSVKLGLSEIYNIQKESL